MSLSVKENRIVAANRVGENSLQTVLQGKVELPGTAAPVGRILWVKGVPTLHSSSVDQDRVYVQGAVDLAMVYAPETLGGEPAGLERVEWPGALPFDAHVEVIGADSAAEASVDLAVLACEWELAPGQFAVDVDLILAITVTVDQVREFTAISSANLAKPAKLLTDGVVLDPAAPPVQLKVAKQITGMLEFGTDDDDLVRTILDLETKIKLDEPTFSEGTVEVKGWAALSLLYETEELTVKARDFSQVLNFELSFEDPKLEPGMALEPCLEARCEGFVVNDGRSVRVELSLGGALLAKKSQPIQVLTDISASGGLVEVRKEAIATDSFVTRKEQQVVARGLLELAQDLPPMREVLKLQAAAHLLDYEVEADKLTIQGVLDVAAFYLAHSEEDVKPLYRGYFPEALPFTQTLAVPGLELGMQPRICLDVLSVRADLINRETLEAAVTLRVQAEVLEYLEVEAVVEAVEIEPAPEDPPTLTFVFAQGSDTVWKLARRYHTTEEAIVQANPNLQEGGQLKPGDCLFIPRK
jgi:hypothetical protein